MIYQYWKRAFHCPISRDVEMLSMECVRRNSKKEFVPLSCTNVAMAVVAQFVRSSTTILKRPLSHAVALSWLQIAGIQCSKCILCGLVSLQGNEALIYHNSCYLCKWGLTASINKPANICYKCTSCSHITCGLHFASAAMPTSMWTFRNGYLNRNALVIIILLKRNVETHLFDANLTS